jgi:hypothetical protein
MQEKMIFKNAEKLASATGDGKKKKGTVSSPL